MYIYYISIVNYRLSHTSAHRITNILFVIYVYVKYIYLNKL